jgi:hypothetical protein
MSPKKPVRTLPTWRGMVVRQDFGKGGDICRHYDSALAATAADAIMYQHASRVTASEFPGCWSAAFRGALRTLNVNLWVLNLQARKDRSVS